MKIGIVSDIHEDYKHLEQSLKVLNKELVDEVACLGDIVGYNDKIPPNSYKRNANESIRLVKENCKFVMPGNHDLNAAQLIPSFKNDIWYPENWFEMSLEEKIDLVGRKIWLYDDELHSDISEENIEYIRDLEHIHFAEHNGVKIMLSHFVYPDIHGTSRTHYTEKKQGRKHRQYMKEKECFVSFVGHAHPEGYWQSARHCFLKYTFAKKPIRRRRSIIFCPSVARIGKRTGVLVFDFKKRTVEAIATRI